MHRHNKRQHHKRLSCWELAECLAQCAGVLLLSSKTCWQNGQWVIKVLRTCCAGQHRYLTQKLLCLSHEGCLECVTESASDSECQLGRMPAIVTLQLALL